MTRDEALAAGLIVGRRHPRLPLTVYNYTPRAVYDRQWDVTTLSHRGLVVEDGGRVVGHCLPKFFNLDEHQVHDWLPPIPAEPFEVMEKLDGSYIGATAYDGEIVVWSRGSFDSPQALAARELMEQSRVDPVDFCKGSTHLFELIGPSHRVVVPYEKDELVQIAAFDASGRSMHVGLCGLEQFRSVRAFKPPTDPADLCGEGTHDAEGYVLRFQSGLYVKVKHAAYVRLHKVVTGLSEYRVFEAVRDIAFERLIEVVPDEWHDWLREVEDRVLTAVRRKLLAYDDAFASLHPLRDDRRVFAAAAKMLEPDVCKAMFQMLDGKDVRPWAWKVVGEQGEWDSRPAFATAATLSEEAA